jgi:hypothetical protein
MAEPNVIDLKQCTMTLKDGTAVTPKTLEIHFDEGNFQYTIKQNVEYRKDRGKLSGGTIRLGDEEPLEVQFEGRFDKLTSDTGELVSIQEFLTQTGAASAFVTTGDPCAPYAIDIEIERINDCGTVKDELFLFPEFRHASIGGNFKDGTLSVQGTCNVILPTSTRS